MYDDPEDEKNYFKFQREVVRSTTSFKLRHFAMSQQSRKFMILLQFQLESQYTKTTSQDQDDLPLKLKIIFLVFRVIVHQIFFRQIFGKIMLDFWQDFDIYLFAQFGPQDGRKVFPLGEIAAIRSYQSVALVGIAYNLRASPLFINLKSKLF